MTNPSDGQPALRADCARCAALCCTAPAFAASADFAIDKPAGRPCPNLHADFRCGIHRDLRRRGFAGCTTYDCFGAGQQTVQVTFGGRDWRQHPDIAADMFAVFAVQRQLHEALWHLTEAAVRCPAGPLRDDLRAAADHTTALTAADPAALRGLDLPGHWRQVAALLRRASTALRRRHGRTGRDHSGVDLAGRDLRQRNLRGANLRGAILIGADLRGVVLAQADLAGADLRGARLDGADLTDVLFLTQPQLDSAAGDPRTRLPSTLTRPGHWPAR
ncbi:pentapeptide repeat-containing protein [Solwaraspora sp. WMMB762]|uniref:pentapeptide repeat-containing protein n=1 Tax=Solwaraspora sp. WMMB762 TaxID=3404120 RepID=UPI003B93B2AB